MGADFPLLSNEILLPNLVFFRSLLGRSYPIELVGEGFGEEVAATRERFQVEELTFDEAVNGFDIALEGASGGRNADMLTVA